MDTRELKALELAARSRITFDGAAWVVPSQTSAVTRYRVSLTDPVSCECDDWQLHRKACKHIIAARLVQERQGGTQAPAIDTDVVPKRPTYKQDWPAYNLAQTQEKKRFLALLADLCSGIEEPAHPGVGRKPVPLRDRVFSVVYKVWSTLSSRRFNTDLEEAHERGYLSRPLHPNKVNCFIESAELTPFLKAMLIRAARPLRAIETAFAVDSSGFTTSRFVRWFDHRYGVTRQEHDWVKVHIACGVKTHVVTAAAIYDRDAADCPVLPELVKKTKETFDVKEVSADKAYLSVDNVEAIFLAGGVPFIAPKVNTTGAAGGLFEKMFHYYEFRREEFLQHYHKRSNVESTFSAVKRKLGDFVRSRTETAMQNEVLAKLVCHNVWCVILSQCELGIEPVFWEQEEEAQGNGALTILPFARPG